MSAEENEQAAKAGYAAFSSGDAAGAMADMEDSLQWNVRGDSALTGTYTGKAEVGELWGKLAQAGFTTEPHDFFAAGDKVVVLATTSVQGGQAEVADILTYNGEGKLIAFDSLSDPALANRAFPK